MNDSGDTRGQLVSRLTEYRQTPDSNNPPEPETIRAARSAALARRSRSRAAPPESFIAGASPLLRGMAHSCAGLQGSAVVDRPINYCGDAKPHAGGPRRAIRAACLRRLLLRPQRGYESGAQAPRIEPRDSFLARAACSSLEFACKLQRSSARGAARAVDAGLPLERAERRA